MVSQSSVPVIRNYRSGDFNRYLGLRQAAGRADRKGRKITAARLREELAEPGRPPRENLILAEEKGVLLGAVLLVPEPGIGRTILKPLVHPNHRGCGLGRLLLERGLSAASARGGRRAQLEVKQADPAGLRFAEKNGFQPVRRFWEMGLDLRLLETPWGEASRTPCGCFLEGQEEALTRLQNESFQGSWGFNPNTVQEVAHTLEMGGGSLKDVLVAFQAGRPSGYCWLKVDREPASGAGTEEGRVHMLGVHPDSRGWGVGRSLLAWGLARLKEMGLGRAVLTVDQLNAPALALYRRAGFQVESETIWYEKELTGSPKTPG